MQLSCKQINTKLIILCLHRATPEDINHSFYLLEDVTQPLEHPTNFLLCGDTNINYPINNHKKKAITRPDDYI